ncbi:MAG: 30S ribosomal protein S2 [Acidimicrobiia bacterium]|nr:30S ribosomal protein S2 [Acidimicrobiia bacterium]MYE74712.1 30S ribosomal protein S2 [Acidimicrobiia bacterium]MYJ60950.1 30S ribosomal protein S2 [Acidimicrobiia bacterium]
MAPVVTMRQLLDAGVHFGHQTRRWNPKMQRFIFGERNGIYIIDLTQTLAHIEAAYTYVRDLVAKGGQVLFVGTKKQAQDSVQSYAERVGMPYVNERWLGGLLTNFETISKRMGKMKEFQRMRSSGELDVMPKKEALLISRELAKLERNLNGIRDLTRPPDAVFVLDTKKEHIAVAEANKLKLPVIAVVDTNCDPDVIQFVIPGNDDAIRSGELMCRIISDAVLEGRFIAQGNASAKSQPTEEAPTKDDTSAAPTEEAPAASEAAAAEEAPAASEAAAAEEAPTVAESQPDGDAPTVSEAAAAEEAPTASEAAPAEEAPTVAESQPDGDVPAAESAEPAVDAESTEPQEQV